MESDLSYQLSSPPPQQIMNGLKRSINRSEMFRLESVEEKVHCTTYKSNTDARFRFFGAPGRFRGAFPDIHNAKVEVSTPESFCPGVNARCEFKPLNPKDTTTTRLSVDLSELLGISGAPTLVVSTDPPFLFNKNTRWNPQLEMDGVTDDGVEWDARYSVSNDGSVLGSLEGEVRYAHATYGDFTASRWAYEDDIEAFTGGGLGRGLNGSLSGADTDDVDSRSGATRSVDGESDSDASTPRKSASPRRSLWNNDGGRGRSASASRSPWGRRRSPGRSGSEASFNSGRSGRGGGRAEPPQPRWLATWRRDFEGFEVAAKVGDAIAVANENAGPHGSGGVSANGGVINSEQGCVTSDTWEAEASARARLQHNLDGKLCARFVAREIEAGMTYHFTEEFKGWHVNAKAVLSPQGIATPEFTLQHVWDF